MVGGSLAHEAGLSLGDEIISIGKEKLPKFATESLVNRILKRQDRFPPPICVISRVHIAQFWVKFIQNSIENLLKISNFVFFLNISPNFPKKKQGKIRFQMIKLCPFLGKNFEFVKTAGRGLRKIN